MTTASYAIGRPRLAVSRGGDCRIFDIAQNRHTSDSHVFAAPSDCRISNGMLRFTVGAAGSVPSLTVEARRGRVVVADYLSDTLSDTLPGSISTPAWLSVGTLTINSPSVAAVLSGVQVVRMNDEVVTIRLVAPDMGNAFVTLERGERQVHIQHGSTRSPLVDIDRRVRLTASPSPVGIVTGLRVEEVTAAAGLDGLLRFVGAIDPATPDASTFSVTASSVTTARFGAGVGTEAWGDRPSHMHNQLGDSSRPSLVVS